MLYKKSGFFNRPEKKVDFLEGPISYFSYKLLNMGYRV